MLLAMAGLPGVGKTTLARELARRLPALHLRIDSLEQALRSAGMSMQAIGAAGYLAAYAVAGDNLRLGAHVVADSVNGLAVTRQAWREVARRAGVDWIDIEVICSDPDEHRRRVASRVADIPGHALPRWDDVCARVNEPWDRQPLSIDTAIGSLEQQLGPLLARLGL